MTVEFDRFAATNMTAAYKLLRRIVKHPSTELEIHNGTVVFSSPCERWELNDDEASVVARMVGEAAS